LGQCGFPIAERFAELLPQSVILSHDLRLTTCEHSTFVRYIFDLNSTSICYVLVQTPNSKYFEGSAPIDFSEPLEDFDYTAIDSVLRNLSRIDYCGTVVVCSTVSPGTMRRFAASYPTLRIAYMPVMVHIGKEAETFLDAPVYFIGHQSNVDPANIMGPLIEAGIPADRFMLGTYEEVELYKMMGNVYCSLKIAFSNTISEIIEAGKLPASSFKVMDALKRDTVRFSSEMYLSPGSGDGGPCHPRDGVVMAYLSKQVATNSQLLIDIAEARERQAEFLAKYLVDFNLPIIILGKSFKPNVDMTTGSYSVLIGEYCKRLGHDVQYDCSATEPSVVLISHRDESLYYKFNLEYCHAIDLWNLELTPQAGGSVHVFGNI